MSSLSVIRHTADKKLDFNTQSVEIHQIVILPVEKVALVPHLSEKIRENW